MITCLRFVACLEMNWIINQDWKVHVANIGPTWVLSAPGGPHVGPRTLLSGKWYTHVSLQTCDVINNTTMLCPIPSLIPENETSQHTWLSSEQKSEEPISLDHIHVMWVFYIDHHSSPDSPGLGRIQGLTLYHNLEFIIFQEPNHIRPFDTYFPYNNRHVEVRVGLRIELLEAWSVSSHYPNQCDNIVDWTLWNTLNRSFNWCSCIFIQENAFTMSPAKGRPFCRGLNEVIMIGVVCWNQLLSFL